MDSRAVTPVITAEPMGAKAHLTKQLRGDLFSCSYFFFLYCPNQKCVPKPTKKKVIFLKQPCKRLTRWVRAARKAARSSSLSLKDKPAWMEMLLRISFLYNKDPRMFVFCRFSLFYILSLRGQSCFVTFNY